MSTGKTGRGDEEAGLLTTEEAMAFLEVSRSTLLRRVKDASLSVKRKGRLVRFSRDDLEAFKAKSQEWR